MTGFLTVDTVRGSSRETFFILFIIIPSVQNPAAVTVLYVCMYDTVFGTVPYSLYILMIYDDTNK